MNFAELHNQHEPLLIANVWDAASAVAAQEAGYQALGTSSAAIASTLGYEDGQGMPFNELFYIVTRIRAVSNLPLSVDMEAGYGDSAEEIVSNLRRLAQTGVSGVNLEDSRVINGRRQLDDVSDFSRNLKTVCNALRSENCSLFLNIRECPELFNQAVIQLFFPFPRQIRLGFLAVGGDLRAVAPLGIQRIGQRDFCRVAAVPAVFGQSDFFDGAFVSEGR